MKRLCYSTDFCLFCKNALFDLSALSTDCLTGELTGIGIYEFSSTFLFLFISWIEPDFLNGAGFTNYVTNLSKWIFLFDPPYSCPPALYLFYSLDIAFLYPSRSNLPLKAYPGVTCRGFTIFGSITYPLDCELKMSPLFAASSVFLLLALTYLDPTALAFIMTFLTVTGLLLKLRCSSTDCCSCSWTRTLSSSCSTGELCAALSRPL